MRRPGLRSRSLRPIPAQVRSRALHRQVVPRQPAVRVAVVLSPQPLVASDRARQGQRQRVAAAALVAR